MTTDVPQAARNGNPRTDETCELRLFIPELAEEKSLGSGCCFVTLDYLVQEELRGWFGVQEVELVPPDQVRVTMGARRHPEVSDMIEALHDLGCSEVRGEALVPVSNANDEALAGS